MTSPPVPGALSSPVAGSRSTFHADQSSFGCDRASLRSAGGKRNSDASSIFGGATILPGFIRLSGIEQRLDLRRTRRSGADRTARPTHSPRHRPSPCSPEYAPLYSRTIAAASSAIARILAAPSRRMSRIGRTCSVPTTGVRVPGAAGAVLRETLRSAARCIRRDARAAPRSPR